MELQELKKIAEESEENMRRYYKKEKGELVVFHALKIVEEVGELSEQILSYYNMQRKEKQVDKEEIGEEIADIILATAVLSESLGLNIEKEILKKVEKNRTRLKN